MSKKSTSIRWWIKIALTERFSFLTLYHQKWEKILFFTLSDKFVAIMIYEWTRLKVNRWWNGTKVQKSQQIFFTLIKDETTSAKPILHAYDTVFITAHKNAQKFLLKQKNVSYLMKSHGHVMILRSVLRRTCSGRRHELSGRLKIIKMHHA